MYLKSFYLCSIWASCRTEGICIHEQEKSMNLAAVNQFREIVPDSSFSILWGKLPSWCLRTLVEMVHASSTWCSLPLLLSCSQHWDENKYFRHVSSYTVVHQYIKLKGLTICLRTSLNHLRLCSSSNVKFMFPPSITLPTGSTEEIEIVWVVCRHFRRKKSRHNSHMHLGPWDIQSCCSHLPSVQRRTENTWSRSSQRSWCC